MNRPQLSAAEQQALTNLMAAVGAEAQKMANTITTAFTNALLDPQQAQEIKELAQKLHEVLMGVLEGESEVEGEVEGEMDSEDAESCADDNDEDENTLGEATHLEELPKSKGESLQSKNNKVGDVTSSLVSKGDGDGAVTDECGTKDTGKHALVQDLDSGNLKGKNNKVASKTSKVGAYLAGLK
jgi:hypothetical protein